MASDIYYEAADAILAALGIGPTPVNVNLLVAWAQNEYTSAELATTNNPLATSLTAAGATGNCTLPNGERSTEPCYDTLADGAAACAATIQAGLYPYLQAGLQNSSTATFFGPGGAAELDGPWSGGSTGYAAQLLSNFQALGTPPAWALGPAPGGPPGSSQPPATSTATGAASPSRALGIIALIVAGLGAAGLIASQVL